MRFHENRILKKYVEKPEYCANIVTISMSGRLPFVLRAGMKRNVSLGNNSILLKVRVFEEHSMRDNPIGLIFSGFLGLDHESNGY